MAHLSEVTIALGPLVDVVEGEETGLLACLRIDEVTAEAEGAPAESSRTATVDSTKKGIELIRRDGWGMELDR